MNVLALAGKHSELEPLVVCLLIVLLVAVAIWFVVGKLFARPDWGNPAAAIVFIVGAILCLV